MSNEKDLRHEYPAELIQSGVRGKYAERYREGTNIVPIDPEVRIGSMADKTNPCHSIFRTVTASFCSIKQNSC